MSAAKVLTVTEFKARCLEIIDGVATRGESVVLTRRSKIVARLVPPAELASEGSPQDTLRGCLDIVGDIVAPVFAPGDWDMNAPPAVTAPDDARSGGREKENAGPRPKGRRARRVTT